MHVSLSPAEAEQLVKHLGLVTIRSRAKLLNAGEVCRKVYFVNKGCLRVYHTDSEGIDHIISFSPENWWATDIASFSCQKVSKFSIDAVEETEVFYLDYNILERLYIQVPKLERFFRILTQNGYSILQRRMISHKSKSALQRYRMFKKQYPKLEQRISQKHIASFLGITPVFLSRLRQLT